MLQYAIGTPRALASGSAEEAGEIFASGLDARPFGEGPLQGWLGSARGHEVDGLDGDPRGPGRLLDLAGLGLRSREQVGRLPGERGVLDSLANRQRLTQLRRGVVPAPADDRELASERMALSQVFRRPRRACHRRRP